MNNPTLSLHSPAELGEYLGSRMKALRLSKGWTRNTLAKRAGIAVSSLKRFENTGKASLDLVLKAAYALGRLEEFGRLLEQPTARSMAELERRAEQRGRKRGHI
jgi:transcriptional regulator with XRE-family HTH domain